LTDLIEDDHHISVLDLKRKIKERNFKI